VNYDRVAGWYDWLATVYSGGGIRRAKHAHVAWLSPGTRVLYLGAGQGQECVAAATRGAHVSAVDSSARMVQLCAARFHAAKQQVQLLQDDALGLPYRESFDVVVAPFFLNVFSTRELPHALKAVFRYLSPGGKFISVDFSAPRPGWFSWVQRAYYLPPLLLFGLCTGNPWHPLYDYVQISRDHGLAMQLHQRTLHLAWGAPLFETLVWTKQNSP